ncbi:MAG: bud emergence protein 1 [Icmadophila ericetorum]|nr:bud emergence protein 1 [Icmadophila ericetorum]
MKRQTLALDPRLHHWTLTDSFVFEHRQSPPVFFAKLAAANSNESGAVQDIISSDSIEINLRLAVEDILLVDLALPDARRRSTMKAIRRSIKGERNDTRSHHISITPKSAIAILPPKKVIKALYDYTPPVDTHGELGFHKGDFFHVISREEDTNWYEACNPLIPNARGLVPVSFFEVIGKTERQSAGSVKSGATSTTPVESTFSSEIATSSKTDSTMTSSTRAPTSGRMSVNSKAMVYGIVLYDFNAERPDELDAKADEAIIIIAQSNPEWFVAKPIGRLGGPGLIPVSFIEIRDMTTGQAVADPQAAVQQAGVPKVEEWKKLAAAYKEGSITLGKFESGNTSSVQRDLQRMSLNNGVNAAPNGNGYPQQANGYGHQRNGSRGGGQQTRNSTQHLLAPVSASIPRYCFENDKYWYIIECVMEDGRHWELARYYENFYDFQIDLLQNFPKEAGQSVNGQPAEPRLLPYMPGPVTYVTDAISNGRRESLNQYVRELLALPPYISKCYLVRQLFAPREGDFELDPKAIDEDFRLSRASQQSSNNNSLSRTASRQSSRGQINGNGTVYPASTQPRSGHQRNQPSNAGLTNGGVTNGSSQGQSVYQNGTDIYQPASIARQPSSLTQTSGQSSNSASATPQPNTSQTNVSTGAIKIKVFFDDDVIVIRLPSDVSFQDLKVKLKERFKVTEGDLVIQYKDEPSRGYAELLSDHDLDVALQRNPKLTLIVGYA